MVVPTNLTGGFMMFKPFWAKLGKDVSAMTANEAIGQAGLDWTVSKSTLTRVKQDGQQVASKCVSLVRDDKDLELAVVGAGYAPLQNNVAFDILNPLIEAGLVELVSAGTIYEGERTWVLAKVLGAEQQVNGQDIELHILCTNSHGYGAVNYGFVPFIKQTGRSLAVLGGTVKLTHRGNIARKVRSLTDAMDLAKGKFVASVNQMAEMQKIGISSEGFKELVKVVIGADGDKGARTLAKILAHGAQVDNVLDAYMAMSGYLNSDDAGRNANSILNSLWYGAGKKHLNKMFENCVALVKEINNGKQSA
jgi:hypothetical protein